MATRPNTILQSSVKGARAGPYGLTMVDYSVPPPKWPLPPSPPTQKGASGQAQRFLGPALFSFFFIGAIYIYFNQDEDIYEYWKQVEQGNVPIDSDEDDDDVDDEWEDDEGDEQKPKA